MGVIVAGFLMISEPFFYHDNFDWNETPLYYEEQISQARTEGGYGPLRDERRQLYVEEILGASRRYGINSDLYLSLIWQESHFANRRSKSGMETSAGLPQMKPSTANDVDDSEYWTPGRLIDNPSKAIHLGARYFATLLSRYNDNALLALAAYNWGMGNLDDCLDRLGPPGETVQACPNKYKRLVMECDVPPVTRAYVTDITKRYQRMQEEQYRE